MTHRQESEMNVMMMNLVIPSLKLVLEVKTSKESSMLKRNEKQTAVHPKPWP